MNHPYRHNNAVSIAGGDLRLVRGADSAEFLRLVWSAHNWVDHTSRLDALEVNQLTGDAPSH